MPDTTERLNQRLEKDLRPARFTRWSCPLSLIRQTFGVSCDRMVTGHATVSELTPRTPEGQKMKNPHVLVALIIVNAALLRGRS